MLRLRVQEPDVGVGDVRHLHLHRLLGHPPLARRPPHLRPLHAARPQLDVAADPPDAVRRQLKRRLILQVSHSDDRIWQVAWTLGWVDLDMGCSILMFGSTQ